MQHFRPHCLVNSSFEAVRQPEHIRTHSCRTLWTTHAFSTQRFDIVRCNTAGLITWSAAPLQLLHELRQRRKNGDPQPQYTLSTGFTVRGREPNVTQQSSWLDSTGECVWQPKAADQSCLRKGKCFADERLNKDKACWRFRALKISVRTRLMS